MRVAAIALQGGRGWPQLVWNQISPGLNVCCGSAGSGKSLLVDLLAHVLYGKPPALPVAGQPLPEGDAIVDSTEGRFRLRRYHDGLSSRLTVAALDDSPATAETVRRLLFGMSPAALARLCAVSFREPPRLEWLLSAEFARDFHTLAGGGGSDRRPRLAALVARRDVLAEELESRIAGERRASSDLNQRWRELERKIRDEQQAITGVDERLRAVEPALAETDARLRYRRLELNVELRWQAETTDLEPQLADLDEQIARCRATMADLAARESNARTRLVQVAPGNGGAETSITDQRAWLAVARQLASDLEGEVARLARAAASEQCRCRDAHPRLRPIVETLARQLDVLETLVHEQHDALRAVDLADEAEHLGRTQSELRRQLERMLERRQSLTRSAQPSRRRGEMQTETEATRTSGEANNNFGAADIAQLEQRRQELEQQRFALVMHRRKHERVLRELRGEREEVERQRAGLLSVRSIEHVQRELAGIQEEIEGLSGGAALHELESPAEASPDRASDFLAQLTNGELVRLELADSGRRASVTNHAGDRLPVETLPARQHDQVYLSLCLALVSAAGYGGARLPVILDEPFARLEARDIAALAAVLDSFARRGHQLLIFTRDLAAARRCHTLGANVVDIDQLRREASDSGLDARPATVAVSRAVKPAKKEAKPPARAAAPRGVRKKSADRFHLEPTAHVAAAPSIGPKTAQRLANSGVHTVADLLSADPVETARRLAARHIKAETIRNWQRQARLVCQIPQLRAQDAQLLVGCGVTSAEQMADLKPADLLEKITAFSSSAEGTKALDGVALPDLLQVKEWILRAGRRRELNAA